MSAELCGAKNKKRDGTCKNSPMENGRCRMHGGLSLRGAASKTFVHGRRSKYLAHLGDYESTHADPEALMDLTHQLTGMELVLERKAERAKDMDVPEFRKEARAKFKDLRAAMLEGDVGEISAKLNALGRIIQDGVNADKAEEVLIRMMERMAYRAEQAWKIRLLSAGTITPQAMRQALEAMGRIALEEAGADVGRKILERFDREIVEGRASINLP